MNLYKYWFRFIYFNRDGQICKDINLLASTDVEAWEEVKKFHMNILLADYILESVQFLAKEPV